MNAVDIGIILEALGITPKKRESSSKPQGKCVKKNGKI